MHTDAIKCVNLSRDFTSKGKTVHALKNINLTVKKGELFGLLGPNGAGKTTLIKILTTLLLPTSGKAYVYGYDVEKDFRQIRPIINMVAGGETSGYGLLTVFENLWMFSQFYGIPNKVATERINSMLARLRIQELAKRKVRALSTGERQKVNIIRGFMTEPMIVFLDEPTLGLDVETARMIRKFVKEWIAENRERTVLLTTHYMMEADELCDRIAIIDRGKIIALDTPSELKKLVKSDVSINLEIKPAIRLDWLGKIEGIVGHTASQQDGKVKLRLVAKDDAVVGEVVSGIYRENGKIVSLHKDEPTLEDVFLKLTGRGLE
ncbi:MAG: ATP-binding cassette domain-containing protein [Thermoplasmata archaeon]